MIVSPTFLAQREVGDMAFMAFLKPFPDWPPIPPNAAGIILLPTNAEGHPIHIHPTTFRLTYFGKGL